MTAIIDGTKGITTPGLYSSTTFTGTYTDGIVVDYTTGMGRISVGTADSLTIYNGGVASTALVTVDSSGNVGIGTTSPTSAVGFTPRVQIAGSYPAYILQGTETSAKKWTIGETAGALAFYNDTDSAERARIDSSGNLLVGTTTSQGKLTVNGAIAPSGAVGSYSIDTSSVNTTYANGATQNFANMSGMIIANSAITGRVTIYIMGGGSTTAVANATGQVGTMAYNSGVAGYTWTNNYGASDNVTFMVFRTRATA